MSRTIHRIPPRTAMWHKADFLIIKDIEHFGYHHDCTYVYSTLYESVEDYFQENYGRDPGTIVTLKKAIAKNNVDLWLRLVGAKATNIRVCKSYTEYEKRTWRQSFKQNKKVADYEDWDYVKYPKLKSFTWRQY